MKNSREYALIGLFAALYVVLTVAIAPFSYGVIQIRLSEMLNHSIIYNKKLGISLIVGVLVANWFSSAGLSDMIIGTAATAISVVIALWGYRYLKNDKQKFIFNIINFTVVGMLPIAIMLQMLGLSETTFILTYLILMLGEAITMTLGHVVFYLIDKRLSLHKLLH